MSLKRVIHRDIEDDDIKIKDFSKADSIKGSLLTNFDDKKLLHSIIENDQETIEDGKLIKEAINMSLSSFTPSDILEHLVKDFRIAKNLYGECIIRQLTGYDPNYIERNIKIPEFQRELKKKIEENVQRLKEKKLLDKDDSINDKGIELASLTLYTEELDNIIAKGTFGEKIHKKHNIYGEKSDTKPFKKQDRYRDLALKKSIKTAVRRKHKKLLKEDLKSFERYSKGQTYVVYAMDASGSMRGKKIDTAKKAGIALAYKAIDKKDKVGLITFGSEIKDSIEPTTNFIDILKTITNTRASTETDIIKTINKAIELFPKENITKHIILLTDALPTVGTDEQTLEKVSLARANNITISLVGINLDEKGEKLAKKIVELGEGRFYIIKDLENVDKIILEDYYEVR